MSIETTRRMSTYPIDLHEMSKLVLYCLHAVCHVLDHLSRPGRT